MQQPPGASENAEKRKRHPPKLMPFNRTDKYPYRFNSTPAATGDKLIIAYTACLVKTQKKEDCSLRSAAVIR